MTAPDTHGAQRTLAGRYRLVREIARGGMAAVWEGHDELLDRRVAIKLLLDKYADDPEFLERFRREARAAASLSHPNVVSVYDVGEDTETRTPFIVMELVEGQNLKDYIRSKAPMPDREIRRLGAALASTLDVAHRRGIIHRDIKPQNVLLGDDGRPRLTDFGIAQALSASQLTRTGAVMGSAHYLAPELVRGKPASPRSDIYALGAVMYEMATGRVPFSGDTELAIALAHVEEPPTPPRTFNAHLDPGLERTILRALAKSPEDRFASAAQLAAVLRQDAAAPPPRTDDARTQRMPTVAGAAVPSASRAPAGRAVYPVGTRQAVPVPAGRKVRPPQRRGAGTGVLVLLLALAAVLVALGAGFFGLASLSREGIATPEPTQRPTTQPTPPPKPVAVPSPTAAPSPTPAPTPEPSATPEPPPTPLPPSPTPIPPTPSPVPPTAVPTPRAGAVPQLRGKTLDDARAALAAVGLTTTVRGVNLNVDRNVVAGQTPEAGTSLPPGGTVTIMVGTGNVEIPEVAERPREQALRLLQDSGFRVTVREQRDQR
ncbi:MAG TPA: protein kinase, partial [Chloroflexota bacterium]|nr:protein kinase [Chloroflexota bacterium]